MITKTITKAEGHGPYFWVVVWKHRNSQQIYTTVYTDHTMACLFGERLKSNGNEVLTIDLGVDRTHEKRDDPPKPEELPPMQWWIVTLRNKISYKQTEKYRVMARSEDDAIEAMRGDEDVEPYFTSDHQDLDQETIEALAEPCSSIPTIESCPQA